MKNAKTLAVVCCGALISLPAYLAAEDEEVKVHDAPRTSLPWSMIRRHIPKPPQHSQNEWYTQGRQSARDNVSTAHEAGLNSQTRAKNIILFLGDGMGVPTLTAARILAGQLRGESGEENELYFENFPHLALAKTYNTNQQTPDSAGTMSAIMTGVKTKAGVISVDDSVVPGDCDTQTPESEMVTALELAELAGMATGVVTTTRITHATPAATYAHIMSRNFEDDRDAAGMSNPGDCDDIAKQMIELPQRLSNKYVTADGLEVALGGGRRGFVPRVDEAGNDVIEPVSGSRGERLDYRDLTAEWLSDYENAAYVTDSAQLAAIDPYSVDHLLGLFHMSSMNYEADRPASEPSIAAMTSKAIEVLKKDRNGFFLVVEGARIDHAHHFNNPYRALSDTLALEEAVKAAYDMTDPRETLIIVTADHSHVMTIAGYPTRGNPILGHVVANDGAGEPDAGEDLAFDGAPYTTLGYTNGKGFLNSDAFWGRVDPLGIDTTLPDYRSETLVPTFFESHGGEDVAIYATGPGSSMISGLVEQNVIFHVMHIAGRLDERRRSWGWGWGR